MSSALIPLIIAPSNCVVATSEITLRASDDGWLEHVEIVVQADGLCPHVDLQLPPGVTVSKMRAKATHNGTTRRLRMFRFERITRDIHGQGAVRVHTPELVLGDSLKLKLERTWPATSYMWSPGQQAARYASLTAAHPLPEPPKGIHKEKTLYWAQAPNTDLLWSIPHPSGHYESPTVKQATLPPMAKLQMHIVAPDPWQRSLYPGGGSSVESTWTIHFQPEPVRRGWVIPIPQNATQVVIDGEYERRDDSIVVIAEPDHGSPHTVSYVTPDAPSYGVRPSLFGAEVTQTVFIDGGQIRTAGDVWWISNINLQRVLPQPRDLVNALNRRFQRSNIPEPGLPIEVRDQTNPIKVAAALRTLLQRRAGVGAVPLDPLFPRPLIRARNSRAITTVEAALILWAELNQARIPATWGVVRPAFSSHSLTSPGSYTEGVVALQLGGRTRWIDPGCRVCGPFELRPHLEGAAMLSPLGAHTPDPTPGNVQITDTNDSRIVEMAGPPALLLRQWLAQIPKNDRLAALGRRFGGKDGTLVSTEGVGDAGESLSLVLKRTALDPITQFLDGSNTEWLGEITWTHPGDSPQRHVHQGSLCWTSQSDSHTISEHLIIARRALSPSTREAVEAARGQNPMPKATDHVTVPASLE